MSELTPMKYRGQVKIISKTGGIIFEEEDNVWYNPVDAIAKSQAIEELKGQVVELTLVPDKKNTYNKIEAWNPEELEQPVVKEEKVVINNIETETPVSKSKEEYEEPASAKKFDKSHLQKISGKTFVKYNGLLDLAHSEGLLELRVLQSGVNMENKTAWCIVRATLSNGKICDGFGSATPENTGSGVKKNFVEMAHTRAKSRALRDILNVDMVAAEEMGG